MDTLAHLPDFYGHHRTVTEQTPVLTDGTPIPWMTYPAVSYLNQLDVSQKQVFEYGCGNSTRYWSQRCRKIVSVEHDADWFARMKGANLAHAEIFHAEGRAYVEMVARDAPHDIIVIDGRWRFDCAVHCTEYLAPGGLVMLDNSERYPAATEFLRKKGLIQVDMIGHGPMTRFISCTSLFLKRDFAFSPAKPLQPHHGPGMHDSIEAKPEHAAHNKAGGYG